jgi:hypothetical protein
LGGSDLTGIGGHSVDACDILSSVPKFPLFKNEPLNQGIIAKLRVIRERPKAEENATLLNDLALLRRDPESPMSERLADFAIDFGLLPNSALSNFLINTIDQPRMTGKPGAMRIEINEWILAHAAAASLNFSGTFE